MSLSRMKMKLNSRSLKLAFLLSLPMIAVAGHEVFQPTSLAFAAKKEKEEEQVDYLGLAARLIADGHEDRAQQMLDQVDLTNEEVDVKKFYTLKGLVLLKQNNAESAVKNFELAVKNGQTEPAIFLYLAQAHFTLQHFRQTIDYLVKAGPEAEAAEKKAKKEAEAAEKQAKAEAEKAKKAAAKKPATTKEAKKEEEIQRVKSRAKTINFKVIGVASSTKLKTRCCSVRMQDAIGMRRRPWNTSTTT